MRPVEKKFDLQDRKWEEYSLEGTWYYDGNRGLVVEL